MTVLIIIFIALFIILFLSWLYIFNIYEIDIKKKEVSSLHYEIQIVPLNSFGSKVPLRSIEYSFELIEGKESVKRVSDLNNGKILIELKNQLNKVKLLVKTDKTQNISIIEIP